MCDILDLFGSSETPVTVAPPLGTYPTKDDARFARDSGFGYGENWQGVLDVVRALSDAGAPISADGMYLDDVPSIPTTPVVDDDSVMRAALAANRSPLAALGFDPRKASVDVVSKGMNVEGFYDPKKDFIFYSRNSASDPEGSALTHEATHRGIKMLQDSPNAVDWPNGSSEEIVVRQLMKANTGDPEQGPTADRYKAGGWYLRDTADGRKFLETLQHAAQREIARRKPGGPR